jgi:hypothetical protein
VTYPFLAKLDITNNVPDICFFPILATISGQYQDIPVFVCRRARQALNDTVKKLEKELKEAQLKEAHSKKQVL